MVELVGKLVVLLVGRAVEAVAFGGRLVLGVAVPFGCSCFDELPSLSDLFFSTAYREMNTTDKTSSTKKDEAKSMRNFEGFLVSGSSSKPKGIAGIFVFVLKTINEIENQRMG